MIDARRREGFALLLAILAVVVAGALIVATHAAVLLDHGVAAAGVARQRAFAATEHALWSSVAVWNSANTSLPVGGSTRALVPAGGVSATVTTVRLSEELYWLVAEATAGDATRPARRRTGISVRVVVDSAGISVSPVSRSWMELR